MREPFGRIYASGRWTLVDEEGRVSRSGLGSNLRQTATLRRALPDLIHDLGVRSILDLPCGDFFWMSQVRLDVDSYIGADLLEDIVRTNRENWGTTGRSFVVLDLRTDELPLADLVFSRDCLVHLTDADIARSLDNVRRSGATYFAATTFTARTENLDVPSGGWRPVNLQLAPHGLPAPFRVINENCSEVSRSTGDGHEVIHRFTDKSIGVWRVADL